MLQRIREASPSFKARIAGVLVLLVILTAAFTEFFFRGGLGFAPDLVVGGRKSGSSLAPHHKKSFSVCH